MTKNLRKKITAEKNPDMDPDSANPACVASTLLVRLGASSFLEASARVNARTSPGTAINS
jgi:hypothetical protein